MLWEAHTRAHLMAELVTLQGTSAGAINEKLQPMEGLVLEKFIGRLSPHQSRAV